MSPHNVIRYYVRYIIMYLRLVATIENTSIPLLCIPGEEIGLYT